MGILIFGEVENIIICGIKIFLFGEVRLLLSVVFDSIIICREYDCYFLDDLRILLFRRFENIVIWGNIVSR